MYLLCDAVLFSQIYDNKNIENRDFYLKFIYFIFSLSLCWVNHNSRCYIREKLRTTIETIFKWRCSKLKGEKILSNYQLMAMHKFSLLITSNKSNWD